MDAETISRWAASVLPPGSGDARSLRWRMLEYWWQVELFVAPPAGIVLLGDHELPYVTTRAHRSKQLGIKWADLVFVALADGVWVVEMKDLGRSADEKRLRSNAVGVARDLAALASIQVVDTLALLGQLGGVASAPTEDLPRRRLAATRDLGRGAEYAEVHRALHAATDAPWSGAVVVLAPGGADQRAKFVEVVREGLAGGMPDEELRIESAVTEVVGASACVIAITVRVADITT